MYHDVNSLSSLGTGVTDAGVSVRSGFDTAAAAADNVPLAGSAISSALRDAGNATGGNVAAVGQAGVEDAHHLAVVLGFLAWGLPSLLLIVSVLPRRLEAARRLHYARLAMRASDAEHKRLVAVRALLNLPDATLFAHTSDPGGDLLAGRYDALVAAAAESEGLRSRLTSGGGLSRR